MRLDVYLVKNGFFSSRELAKYNITHGNILVNGEEALKSSRIIGHEDVVSLKQQNLMTYVSRGGFKLEKALAAFSFNCQGLDVIDVGASTGGFTDCVLQHGAARVVAIDVGTNQLVAELKNDPRVTSFEGVSIKDIQSIEFVPRQFHLLVADLSFISLTKVMEMFPSLIVPDGSAILLIKPQFEVGKELIGKGGIVKSAKAHIKAIEAVVDAAAHEGLYLQGLTWAPIVDESKNVEYLGHFMRVPHEPIDIHSVVQHILSRGF